MTSPEHMFIDNFIKIKGIEYDKITELLDNPLT